MLSQVFKAPGNSSSTPSNPVIYCTTLYQYALLNNALLASGHQSPTRVFPENQFRALPYFPVELGISNVGELEREQGNLTTCKAQEKPTCLEDQVAVLKKNSPVKVAIINGFGFGIGDTIVGLTALREAKRVFHKHGISEVKFDIYLRNKASAGLRSIIKKDKDIRHIFPLPITLPLLLSYDAFWDFSGLIERPGFDELPMVDFYLQTMGISPDSVLPERKVNKINNKIKTNSRLARLLSGIDGKILLFHPKSSTPLRDMPDRHINRFLKELLTETSYTVITTVPIRFHHKRFLDLSKYSKTFDIFLSIISRADRIITVDTCVYHISNACNIPTVVLFTTIPPELRIKYYPQVKGMLLSGAENTSLFKEHKETGETDSKILDELWGHLSAKEVISLL